MKDKIIATILLIILLILPAMGWIIFGGPLRAIFMFIFFGVVGFLMVMFAKHTED